MIEDRRWSGEGRFQTPDFKVAKQHNRSLQPASQRCPFHAREALIKSLSDFILVFLFNARNKSTRIASYLRRLMTQHWIKIHMKFDSAN